MGLYSALLRPLLFRSDPEWAHERAIALAARTQRIPALRSVSRLLWEVDAPSLQCTVLNLRFRNPVGLAAGFDKNAVLLPTLADMGFGFIEVGSITAHASHGNQRPRLFRLPQDEALINRMGLNNEGPAPICSRVSEFVASSPAVIIGINVAKTNDPSIVGRAAVEDVVACFRLVALRGAFAVLNVSCPNSEDGRTFESGPGLSELLDAISRERASLHRAVPLLVKFSPDIPLETLEQNIHTCLAADVDGFVLTNTSTARDGLATPLETLNAIGKGGLSGRPLFERALERVRFAYRILRGRKPIIGVGGIDSGTRAYAMMRAGANLIELYSALVYRGPAVVSEICRELERLLRADGFSNITEIVGSEQL